MRRRYPAATLCRQGRRQPRSNGARFGPNVGAQVCREIADYPERLGPWGSSIRDWLGPDAIERIRAKVTAFYGPRSGLPMSIRFSRLDRPAIRKLQPGEKITEHGITAERLADGDLRYSVNVMVDGLRIHRVIGKEKEGVTRTRARGVH